MSDAQEILEVLFKVQSEHLQWEPDDPQVGVVEWAWSQHMVIRSNMLVSDLLHDRVMGSDV